MTSPDGRPPSLRLRPSGAAGKAVAARSRAVAKQSLRLKAGGNHAGLVHVGCGSLKTSASMSLGDCNARCASSFILSCRLRGRAAGRRAHHAGAILPIAVGAVDRRFGRRRRPRHRGAADGAMVVGAARAPVHRREPTGRFGQPCPPRGPAPTPPPPAGYTLALLGVNNAINASLYNKAGFEFLRDIAPVGAVMRVPLVMVVNPSFPATTVPQFIGYAKANPGKITMGSGGVGTSIH